MKKLYRTKIGMLLIFALTIVSCEDYLSEVPDNRTEIDSPEKISELLVIAYPEANYMDFAETMSDNVSDKNSELPSELNLANYKWEDNNIDDLDYRVTYWNACYKAIAQANQALASIQELGDLDELAPQKGEALLARAYSHFMLVNFWGKHYNPNTADSDLGIPYVLEPEDDFIVTYSRNTVKEVYDFIESDLLEGLDLVTNDYDQPVFHFTQNAAYAFATRFYLFKGEWESVIEYSSKVITNPEEQLRDYLGTYDALEYSERTALYASEADPANLLVVSANSIYARTFASNNFGLNIDKGDKLFFDRNILEKNWAYAVFGTEAFYNLPKFDEFFRYTNINAGIGDPYVGLVLFSTDEVLLNRAEAFAMMNDFDSALLDINMFYSLRTENYDASTDLLVKQDLVDAYLEEANEYSPFYNLDLDQTSFIEAIAELKRREFYHEGLRWFDVRRFDLEVTHTIIGEGDFILTKGDPRRQLQIPNFALERGLEQNPR
ncbi:RagB/SusD family nutrient uptake outer membrane protein [Cellulophaga baltica]|uniref:RagB/SusD family nutrient uptake outer membrane protein n=1 Tax=Cellulophaga TaxID=104264 RepID=UPI001C0762CC|nr:MULTISPECIES: RagB/SusD family nutrient uptake outer membrane protein [Cellulophaga]MBU2997190.1 RagB/SusD family nutrient uptake outer membrane protein [Cellulophaga baltica]MDO6768588.1 RagB/SusD family nutrient uptake outer membrane protein [Cellulophaga sp. 1_MG-2023]